MQLQQSPVRKSCPIFFNLSKEVDRERLQKLNESGEILHTVDQYELELKELCAIENPSRALSAAFEEFFKEFLASKLQKASLTEQGTWVYFPWLFTLVHLLDDAEYQKVRTARNRNLITEEEQRLFYGARVAIAGLSVGNSVALAIVLQGGARHIKLADHDTLELSNLNRIRAGVESLGVPKVEITARQIYVLDPYAQVEIFPNGLTEETLPNFFADIDIVIDEIDNLAMKYRIREEAKKKKLPVLMAADNADSGVLDIERYDNDPTVLPFHGRISASYEELNALDKKGIGRTIATMIGLENHNERMLSSLQALGKTIASWPQLGGTALLNGTALAYCVRKIVTKEPTINNRAILSLEETLDPSFHFEENIKKRNIAIEVLRNVFEI